MQTAVYLPVEMPQHSLALYHNHSSENVAVFDKTAQSPTVPSQRLAYKAHNMALVP